MSLPPNPLAIYRSYSYQHILLASNTTLVLDALCSTSTSESAFSFEDEILGKRNNADPYGVISTTVGDLVVLIDSRKDSRFIMDDIKIEQLLVGSGDNIQKASVEASMRVYEPISSGLFLTTLKQVQQNLGSPSPLTTVIILKTLFYGYKDDGGVDVISDTRPVGFTIKSMVGDFTERGSEYDIELLGMVNGVGHISELATLKGVLNSFTIKTSIRLTDVVQDFVEQLNAAYKKKAFDPIEKQMRDKPDSPPVTGLSFIINVDPAYSDSKYVLGDVNPKSTPTTGPVGVGTPIAFGEAVGNSNFDITSGIKDIFNKCPEVLKEGNPTIGFIPKIEVHPIIKPNEPMVLVYTVTRYHQPKTKEQTIEDRRKQQEEAERVKTEAFTKEYTNTILSNAGLPVEQPKPVQPAFTVVPVSNTPDIEGMLILDYLYTGRNIDVLDFGMKMDNLVVFLSSGTFSTNHTGGDGYQPKNAGGAIYHNTPSGPLMSPETSQIVAVPRLARNTSLLSSVAPANRAVMMKELSNFAGLNNWDVDVTIMGNPLFFGAMNVNPASVGTRRWEKQPYRVKINVMGTDPDTNELYPFWYQGSYLIYTITHKFENGVFTQKLGCFPEQAEPITPQPIDVQPKREGVPIAPTPQTAEAYVNTGGCYVTPERGKHLDPIFEAATAEYGLPCGLLSRICKQESNYVNIMSNNSKGCTGLMQLRVVGPYCHPDDRWWKGKPFDAHNPEIAIHYAAAMLDHLKNKSHYGFNWAQTIAAYNAGEGNVENAMKLGRSDWMSHLPRQSETVPYVRGVISDCNLGPIA